MTKTAVWTFEEDLKRVRWNIAACQHHPDRRRWLPDARKWLRIAQYNKPAKLPAYLQREYEELVVLMMLLEAEAGL